ncbi:MAG: SPOR domain-containing protein [Candidatus Berkiellales bacterium]
MRQRSDDFGYEEEALTDKYDKFNHDQSDKFTDQFPEEYDELSDDDLVSAVTGKKAKRAFKWASRPVSLGLLIGITLGGAYLLFNNKVKVEEETEVTVPVNMAQVSENWESKNITPQKGDNVVFQFDKPDPKDMVEEDLTPEPEGRAMPLANQVQELKPAENSKVNKAEKLEKSKKTEVATAEAAALQAEVSPISKQPVKTKIKKPVIKLAEKGKKPTKDKALTVQEKALMTAKSNHYTLQLFGTKSEESVKKFITTHGLASKSHYFKTKRNGSEMYIVVYGDYASKEQAKADPVISSLKKDKIQPWVRELKSVQQDIQG